MEDYKEKYAKLEDKCKQLLEMHEDQRKEAISGTDNRNQYWAKPKTPPELLRKKSRERDKDKDSCVVRTRKLKSSESRNCTFINSVVLLRQFRGSDFKSFMSSEDSFLLSLSCYDFQSLWTGWNLNSRLKICPIFKIHFKSPK